MRRRSSGTLTLWRHLSWLLPQPLSTDLLELLNLLSFLVTLSLETAPAVSRHTPGAAVAFSPLALAGAGFEHWQRRLT